MRTLDEQNLVEGPVRKTRLVSIRQECNDAQDRAGIIRQRDGTGRDGERLADGNALARRVDLLVERGVEAARPETARSGRPDRRTAHKTIWLPTIESNSRYERHDVSAMRWL